MSDESFLLVSLKENQAKKLAQVLSNDTSRQILDYLSKKERATETEISKNLSLPLSTVHYNMQHLVAAKLVNGDEFTYSSKGKEIIHYSLSNKYVIIAPTTTESLKDKLRSILPIMIIISVASVIINYLNVPGQNIMKAASDQAYVARSAEISEALITAPQTPTANVAVWFFGGALIAMLLSLSLSYLIKKIKRK